MASIIVKVSARATRETKSATKLLGVGYDLGSVQAKKDVAVEVLRAARKLIKMDVPFEECPKWARKALIAAGDYEAA